MFTFPQVRYKKKLRTLKSRDYADSRMLSKNFFWFIQTIFYNILYTAHKMHDVYMKTSSSIFPLENVKALGNSLNQEISVTLRMCEEFFLKSHWTLLDIFKKNLSMKIFICFCSNTIYAPTLKLSQFISIYIIF